ncbi:unnamed protein product [Adineta ricciae]|uniref:PA domain-containing protein n=1 Tax=Adineta ricciae TaxID=249248 RepID=A0A814FB39_ADIRI|nr:unnamed protein product [Adineta ricciae]CAF1389838.1 unnamed protein product [Adineta ricciae]
MATNGLTKLRLLITLGVIGLFGIITFALAAVTLGTLNKRLDAVDGKLLAIAAGSLTTLSTVITMTPSQNLSLVTSIDVIDVLKHLHELQSIADRANGTRAINTRGFNETLQYIKYTLSRKTNFTVIEDSFPVRDFALNSDPVFISSVNGTIKIYTFSLDLTKADFLYAKYSTGSNITDIGYVSVIPNGGCNETDWQNVISGRIALIKKEGDCSSRQRISHATKYNASGILFYNNGRSSEDLAPIKIILSQDNILPVLFLSHKVGQDLVDAILNQSSNVTVQLGIDVKSLPAFPVGNICAYTSSGNATQTILIGSHADSVPEGPGINDNGIRLK